MMTLSRITVFTSLVLLTAASSAGRASAAPVQSGSAPAGDREIGDYVNSETALLELFIGPWKVTENHFNKRGDVVATTKGTEEVRWIMDKHAIERNYITSTGSTVFRAIGLLTWNDALKRYQGAWFDNTTTSGPNSVKGEWNEDTRTMVFTIESSAKDGSTILHKVVERFVDKERRVATTYLVAGTNVVKLLEVRYKRTIPCPAGVRIIFDGLESRRGD